MTYFKGKLGEGHVKDGKSLDQDTDWGLVAKTGTVLIMSIIVEKVALLVDKGKYQDQRNTCPYCYKTHLGVMEDKGWLQW